MVDNKTVRPPTGAGALRFTVPLVDAPPVNDVKARTTELMVAAWVTTRFFDWVRSNTAETTTVVEVTGAVVVIVKSANA